MTVATLNSFISSHRLQSLPGRQTGACCSACPYVSSKLLPNEAPEPSPPAKCRVLVLIFNDAESHATTTTPPEDAIAQPAHATPTAVGEPDTAVLNHSQFEQVP